jgi:hypothetical protein
VWTRNSTFVSVCMHAACVAVSLLPLRCVVIRVGAVTSSAWVRWIHGLSQCHLKAQPLRRGPFCSLNMEQSLTDRCVENRGGSRQFVPIDQPLMAHSMRHLRRCAVYQIACDRGCVNYQNHRCVRFVTTSSRYLRNVVSTKCATVEWHARLLQR